MVDVIIAIPTFRRPRGLERLLTAIGKLETTVQVSVLVADNDAERGDGAAICERFRTSGYRWPLEWIMVRERGIAQTRNALVAQALANSRAAFVAMIDDDEWPDKNWLDSFLQAQARTGADVLYGAVLREFERQPGIWAAHCPGVASTRITSRSNDTMPGAGNVLLRRACLEELPKPCFDPAFALTGGEDKDFFTRLKNQGRKFAGVDDAVCTEFVPASRANLRWALQRAYRIGNSDMRVTLKHEAAMAMPREVLKIAGTALLFPFLFLAALPFAAHRAGPLCKLYRAAGKVAALFGRHFNEYAVVHGD